MKGLVSATLALSILGGTAASAQEYRYGYGDRDFHRGYYDDSYYSYHHRNDGAAIAAGIGIVALVAILASQHHHHYHDGWYGDGGWRDHGDGYYGYRDRYDYGAYDGGY
jgi:hypothetical protein